jgi:hypothetical protein
VPDLLRVAEPLASLGLSPDNNGTITDVRAPFKTREQSPAARAGLIPGDRLDLSRMTCDAPLSANCDSLLAVLGDYGGMQYTRLGTQVTLIVQPAQGGASRIVHITAAPAHLRWRSLVLLVADTVAAIILIIVAFHLVWRRPSRMTWGFFLYAIWFNSGQDYAFYAFIQPWPGVMLAEQFIEALVSGAAYAGLLAFALRFPGETIAPVWRRFDRALPWIAGVVAVATLMGGAHLFGFHTELISDLVLSAIIPLDVVAILVLVLRLRHLPPQDEERMRWVIAGFAIGLPAFLIAELWQSTGLPYTLFGIDPSQPTVELLYLFHGVIAYFVGTAVRRRRVVSVAIPLRRGAILAVLTFVLGVPIVYLHERLTAYNGTVDGSLHLPEWVWPLVIGPLALLALTTLHRRSVELTERALNRRYHRARERLGHAGRTMLKAKDFGEIDRLLTEIPLQSLRLSSAAVFRSVDGVLRRTGPAIGWAATGLTTLDAAQDAIALACLARGQPTALPRGHWHRAGLPADDQSPCLAVPVHGGATESMAIILFGPHLTGSDINPDERDLLRDFASQAALGYDRVETEGLRREVKALREALTALASRPS